MLLNSALAFASRSACSLRKPWRSPGRSRKRRVRFSSAAVSRALTWSCLRAVSSASTFLRRAASRPVGFSLPWAGGGAAAVGLRLQLVEARRRRVARRQPVRRRALADLDAELVGQVAVERGAVL